MYSISEIASLTGVSMEMIRKYERMGLIKIIRNPESNYRKYSVFDLRKIMMIRVYRNMGLSLENIQQLLITPEITDRQEILSRQAIALEEQLSRTKKMLEEINRLNVNLKTISPDNQKSIINNIKSPVFYGLYLGSKFNIKKASPLLAKWLSIMPASNFGLLIDKPDSNELSRYLLIKKEDAESNNFPTIENSNLFDSTLCDHFIMRFTMNIEINYSYDFQVREALKTMLGNNYQFKNQ